MKIFNNLINSLTGKPHPVEPEKPSSQRESNGLTNQELLNQIKQHFEKRFKEETTDEGMLFPTSFTLYMNPNDYARREQAFAHVTQGAVQKLQRFIREKKAEYPPYIPHAKYWRFQFLQVDPEDLIAELGDDTSMITEGVVVIASDLYSRDLSAQNIGNEANVRATIKPKGSDMMEFNINLAAFAKVDMRTKNLFQVKMTDHFNDTQELPQPFDAAREVEERTIATLTCTGAEFVSGDRTGNRYAMVDNLINISGRNDKRSAVARINRDDIIASHAQIRYLPAEKRFEIAAFGDTRLNTSRIAQSTGSTITWKPLANNSDILINGVISIKFLKKV
ncbi:MAG: hypothetical protein LBN06_00745 [Prevotellaceae bacterium]|jgi:hypothetical protein|nr:hypothetical protein [Prevotellaceae bacterium]